MNPLLQTLEEEEGREASTWERGINWLPPICARTGDHMCPDCGLNLQPSASHLQIFTTNVENVGVNAGDLRSKGGPGNGEEAPVRDTPLRKYLGAETEGGPQKQSNTWMR